MEGTRNGVPRRRKGTEFPKFVKYQAIFDLFLKQPMSDECTSLQTHASIQPIMCTDAAQHDSMSTLQAVLSKSLQDQMISDEEIDEDDVQDISSVDDHSACSIPLLANYSSKQIQSTTIETVGHNSAEAASIEDMYNLCLVTYRIPQPQMLWNSYSQNSLHCNQLNVL